VFDGRGTGSVTDCCDRCPEHAGYTGNSVRNVADESGAGLCRTEGRRVVGDCAAGDECRGGRCIPYDPSTEVTAEGCDGLGGRCGCEVADGRGTGSIIDCCDECADHFGYTGNYVRNANDEAGGSLCRVDGGRVVGDCALGDLCAGGRCQPYTRTELSAEECMDLGGRCGCEVADEWATGTVVDCCDRCGDHAGYTGQQIPNTNDTELPPDAGYDDEPWPESWCYEDELECATGACDPGAEDVTCFAGCVPPEAVCDEWPDCSDGSDEDC
jgi:hypothetical protein